MRASRTRRLVVAVVALLPITTVACSEQGEEGGNGDGDRTTLTIWNPDGREQWVESLQIAVDAFEQQQEQYDVEVVNVPFEDYERQLQAAQVSGDVPDIMYGIRTQGYEWANQEITVPLDDVVEQVGEDEFYAGQLENNSLEDQVYAIPMMTLPHLVFYRADWYKRQGLEPAESWDELIANAEALDTEEDAGFLIYNKPPEGLFLLNLMASFGADTFGPDGEVVLDSPETAEALSVAAKLATMSPPGSASKNQGDQRLAFTAGAGAHLISSSSTLGALSESEEMMEVVGASQLPNGSPEGDPLVDLSVWAVADGPNSEGAKDFLTTFFSEQVYNDFIAATVPGFLPSMKSVLLSDEYWSSPAMAPFSAMREPAIRTIENGIQADQRYGPHVYTSALRAAGVRNQMVNMVLSGTEPTAAAEWGAQAVKDIVEEAS